MNKSGELQKTVICMKWGTVFSPDYVNVLFRACRDNISGDFNFLCMTDDPSGLLSEIIAEPIPELGIPPEKFRSGAWPKLAIFGKELFGLQGRALYIDLDTFIFGNLDPFFELKAPFLAIGHGVSWPEKSRLNYFRSEEALRKASETAVCSGPGSLGGGFLGFTIGEQTGLLDRFLADPERAYATYPTDQDYLLGELDDWTPWPYGWVTSLKRQWRQPIVLDRIFEPRSPVGKAPVLAFHGLPRPMDLITDSKSGWREFPHYWKGPVSWARDYWLKYGGRIE